MKNPILELKSVTKSFGEDFTLDNINISLLPGEVHVLIGENGSGKSTIMNIISGVIQQDSGRIFINRNLTDILSISNAKKHGILYIMQDTNSFNNFTVAENVFLDKMPFSGKLLKVIDYDKLFFKCQNLFDKLKIPINVREKANILGLAERQLIEFAKAYISDAKIVIFDEPSAALTNIERDILFFIIRSLKKRGVGIFYISHKLEEIKKIGDRVTVIRNGNIVGSRELSGIDNKEIIKMMTGFIHKKHYPKLDISLGPDVLSVHNLYSNNVLTNISFNLRKGEIIGITGLVGSGRTRLAHCIFGAVEPTAGTILINGKVVHLSSPADAISHGIAYVPEDRASDSIFEYLDVTHNITISSLKRFTHFGKLYTTMVGGTVRGYVKKLNINPGFSHDILASYSGGNQQKVVLAKWIMSRSKIFILDEPTRGIDVVSKVDIYNSINDLVTKGASVIFISSDIDEILGMCDRIMVLTHGQIVCQLPRHKATKEKILHYATLDSNEIT